MSCDRVRSVVVGNVGSGWSGHIPVKPRNPCPQVGCPEFQPCPTHYVERPAWRTTVTSRHERGYGSRWDKIRAQQLREHKWCQICGKRATNVDHKKAKAFGGDDHPLNLQSLCDSCKRIKDAADAQLGRLRRRVGGQ